MVVAEGLSRDDRTSRDSRLERITLECGGLDGQARGMGHVVAVSRDGPDAAWIEVSSCDFADLP